MTGSLLQLQDLPPARATAALDLVEFMLGEGLQATDANDVLSGMSQRIRAAGVPLDRATSIVPLLHAEATASARFWERDKGVRSFTFPYSPVSGAQYARSPAAVVHETREWLILWLPDVAPDAYDIVDDLKADGFVHYIMAPVFMKSGMAATFSFATRDPDGFSALDIAFLRAAFPALSACQEILTTHRAMHEVMRMYVGEEPHRRILKGDVHRGEVVHVRSALLFADMRRFTELTADMSATEATALLNTYYDCVVPPVEAEGGEVLKFMGDGILAMFRDTGAAADTCAQALRAASAGLAAVAAHDGTPPFDVGVALHFGEAAYGNVGSGIRLDYTVIGRDVNLAARVAGLCGTLNEPLLASAAFHAHLTGADSRSVGLHTLKGLPAPQEVFALGR